MEFTEFVSCTKIVQIDGKEVRARETEMLTALLKVANFPDRNVSTAQNELPFESFATKMMEQQTFYFRL